MWGFFEGTKPLKCSEEDSFEFVELSIRENVLSAANWFRWIRQKAIGKVERKKNLLFYYY